MDRNILTWYGRASNWGIISTRTVQGNDQQSTSSAVWSQSLIFGSRVIHWSVPSELSPYIVNILVVTKDSDRCFFLIELTFTKFLPLLVPFSFMNFHLQHLKSWSDFSDDSLQSRAAGWFLMYGGGLGYSHSVISKAEAVICEISRLASENLLRWKRKWHWNKIVNNK